MATRTDTDLRRAPAKDALPQRDLREWKPGLRHLSEEERVLARELSDLGRPSLAGRPHPDRPERQVGPAGRILVMGVACFAAWALVAAPGLLRAAEASPLGARRSVSLAVLRPIARVSAFFSLDRIGKTADRALGRGPSAAPALLPPLAPEPDPAPVVAPTDGPPRGGHPLASPSPDPQPSSTGRPFAVHPPTTADPLTVLAIGDSVGTDMGQALTNMLGSKSGFHPRLDGRSSTGLARPDYFNWPYQVGLDLRDVRPDVVVAMFGANDAQNFLSAGHAVAFGTKEWRRIYGARVASIMDQVTASGRPLVWVGLPPMGRPGMSPKMEAINEVVRGQAHLHPGAVYMDSWGILSNSNGGFASYLPDGSGQQELVRQPDGVHLTMAGSDRLARAVYATMSNLWDDSD